MIDLKINTAELKDLQRKFRQLEKYSKKEAIKEVYTAMSEAQATAVQEAPVAESYGGTLKGSIQLKVYNDGAEMYSTANYAPYVEFGTGKRYVSPNDATKLGIPSSYIAQFKGKGIKEVNLEPQPFFYGSAAKAYKKMLNRLTKRLKRIVK